MIDNRYAIVATATGATGATASDSQWGAVLGVGLEYGFLPNWSVAIEYDHIFIRDQTSNFIVVGGGAIASNFTGDADRYPRGSISLWCDGPRNRAELEHPRGAQPSIGAALSFECPIV